MNHSSVDIVNHDLRLLIQFGVADADMCSAYAARLAEQ